MIYFKIYVSIVQKGSLRRLNELGESGGKDSGKEESLEKYIFIFDALLKFYVLSIF